MKFLEGYEGKLSSTGILKEIEVYSQYIHIWGILNSLSKLIEVLKKLRGFEENLSEHEYARGEQIILTVVTKNEEAYKVKGKGINNKVPPTLKEGG